MSCLSCEQVMERIGKAEADARELSLENALLKHDLERLADCELSLRAFDPGQSSEYWLRHPESRGEK